MLDASELVSHVHEFLYREIRCESIPQPALKKGSILLARWTDTVVLDGMNAINVIIKLTPNKKFWVSLNGKVRMVRTQKEVEEILQLTKTEGLRKHLAGLRAAGEELARTLRESGAKDTKPFQTYGESYVFAAFDMGQCLVNISSRDDSIFNNKIVAIEIGNYLNKCHPKNFKKTLRKMLRKIGSENH